MAKKIKRIALAVTALLAIGIAALAWSMSDKLGDMHISTDRPEQPGSEKNENRQNVSTTPASDTTESAPEDFYILIVGMDTRPSSRTMNTDTLILMHVLPQHETIKMVSLPRDLRMESDTNGVRKINFLFYEGYLETLRKTQENPALLSGKKTSIGGLKFPEEHIGGGLAHLRDEIETWMGIDIRHIVLVDFESIISLVDAVGGIEIEVKRSMYYDDPTDGTHIRFEPGLQEMDGQQALNYARFRHDNRGPQYDSNDFERADRQQQIIMALTDKLVSWKSVGRLINITDIVSSSIKTDMTRSEMMSYIQKYYKTFDSSSLVSIPFNGYWEAPYVKISDEEFQKLKRQFTDTGSPLQEQPSIVRGNGPMES